MADERPDASLADAVDWLRRGGEGADEVAAAVAALRITPGADGPPDGGPAADGADRPPPGRPAARPAGRSGPDGGGGPRGPAPPPRGDHDPVADGGPPGDRGRAPRRGADGARVLRRDGVQHRPRLYRQADAALDAAGEGRGRARAVAAGEATDAGGTAPGRRG